MDKPNDNNDNSRAYQIKTKQIKRNKKIIIKYLEPNCESMLIVSIKCEKYRTNKLF